MAAIALADTGFLVGLLRDRDRHSGWAAEQASMSLPPWLTCEAVLAEAFHLLTPLGTPGLISLLLRRSVIVSFDLTREKESVISLMQKYSDVPMSLADACLVRMTEIHADSIVLTTDTDFSIYRRLGRRVIPCAMPS